MKQLTLMALLLTLPLLTFALPPAPAKAQIKAPSKPPAKNVARTPSKMKRVEVFVGTKILIESYDESSDTFTMVLLQTPGIGPNVATPEHIREGIGLTIDTATFRRKRDDYVGSEFVVTKALPLLFNSEVQQRRQARASRK
jgi:hypothetical protein